MLGQSALVHRLKVTINLVHTGIYIGDKIYKTGVNKETSFAEFDTLVTLFAPVFLSF